MKLRLPVLVICMMLAASSPSGAETLTFDDLPPRLYVSTLKYGGLTFGTPLLVAPYQGTHRSAPHVAIGAIQGASFSSTDNKPFFLNDLWVGSYALEPLHGEIVLILPDRSEERRSFVLSPHQQTLITINRRVTGVQFPSRHNYPSNNDSVRVESLLRPDYRGQAGAVTLDNIRINEPAGPCAYTFTSGSSVDLFSWCLTATGNIAKLETPAGQHHQLGGAEGYAVCSASGLHGADFGDPIPVPFSPPTVVSGCTGGPTCTISRDTTDGVFRLVQKFTQNTKHKEINIDHTLANISGWAANDVELVRVSAFAVNNDRGDEWGDASARSAWLRDVDRVGSTASTLTMPATAFVVEDPPTGCTAAAVAVPAPPGVGREYATQINYHLGAIEAGKKKTVRVQIRRD